MTSLDLHTKLRSAITARLEVARAAAAEWTTIGYVVQTGPEDLVPFVASDAVSQFAALHDPADAIRRYERDLRVLDRHTPTDRDKGRYGITCTGCPNSAASWPCNEWSDLVAAYPEVTDDDA